MKKATMELVVVVSMLISSLSFPQSIGLSFGKGYYNTYLSYRDINNKYLDIPIKNIFFQYDQEISSAFHLIFSVGYGWAKANYIEQIGKVGDKFSYSDQSNSKTEGYPIELEIRYSHYIDADSTFAPFIGLGGGYSNFKSTFQHNYFSSNFESEFTSKGFTQYISFGLNVRISKKVLSFLEFKKMMLNNIEISGGLKPLTQIENSTFTEDYISKSGLMDIGISFGISYNL